jgi:hypothetical protein
MRPRDSAETLKSVGIIKSNGKGLAVGINKGGNMKPMTETQCLDKAVQLLEMFIKCGTSNEVLPMREVSRIAQEFINKDYCEQ